jgi:hypothetical protein
MRRRWVALWIAAGCGGGPAATTCPCDAPADATLGADAPGPPDAPGAPDAAQAPTDAPLPRVDGAGPGVALLEPDHAQPRALVALNGAFDAFADVAAIDVELAAAGGGQVRAKVYSRSTRNQIVIAVPGGAATGTVSVSTPPGTYVSSQPLTVEAPKTCTIAMPESCDLVPMDTLTSADVAGVALTPGAAILFPADGRLVRASDADREDWKRDASPGRVAGRPAFDGTTLLAPLLSEPLLLRSADGIDWTVLDIGASAVIDRVYAFGAGMFVAFAGAQAFWTADVDHWHAGTVPATTGALHDVALAGARLVAVGSDGSKARVWTSDDGGMSWTDRPSAGAATSAELRGVAASGPAALAVGAGGAILKSGDAGATWAPLSSGGLTTGDLYGAGTAANVFVIAGAGGLLGLVAKDFRSATLTHFVPPTTFRAVDPPFLSGDGGQVVQVLGL